MVPITEECHKISDQVNICKTIFQYDYLCKVIRRRTLRDVICENTNIRNLQKKVMKRSDRNNQEFSCRNTNELDFNVVVDNLAIDETIGTNKKPEPEVSKVTMKSIFYKSVAMK